MNNIFKIRKFFRIIVIFVALIIFCDFVVVIYNFFLNDVKTISFPNLFILAVCNLALVHCTISFNKTKYEIGDDTLTAKQFFGKDKKYLFSEFIGIEEATAGPFIYIKLFIKNNKSFSLPPLDNQKEFVKIIQLKMEEKSSIG